MRQIDPIKAKVTNPSVRVYDLPKVQTTQQTNATWEYRVVGGIAFLLVLAAVYLLFN